MTSNSGGRAALGSLAKSMWLGFCQWSANQTRVNDLDQSMVFLDFHLAFVAHRLALLPHEHLNDCLLYPARRIYLFDTAGFVEVDSRSGHPPRGAVRPLAGRYNAH